VSGWKRFDSVRFDKLLARGACGHYLALGGAAQQAVRPEDLAAAGAHRLSARLPFRIVGSGLPDEGVFGVGGGFHAWRPSASASGFLPGQAAMVLMIARAAVMMATKTPPWIHKALYSSVLIVMASFSKSVLVATSAR